MKLQKQLLELWSTNSYARWMCDFALTVAGDEHPAVTSRRHCCKS